MMKVLFGLLLGMVGVALLIDVPGHFQAPRFWILRTVVAGLLLVALWCYIKIVHTDPLRGSYKRQPDGSPDEAFVKNLQLQAGDRRWDYASLYVFLLGIIKPTDLRERVVEEYEPNRSALHHQVSIDVRIPLHNGLARRDHDQPGQATGSDDQLSPAGRPLPIPVLISRKGNLHDSLVVMDGASAQIPHLSYVEYLQLVAALIRTLLVLAYGIREDGQRLPDVAIEAEEAALKAVIGATNTAEVGREAARRLQALSNDGPHGTTIPDLRILSVAARVVVALANHYAVVALQQVQADGHTIVRYTQRVVPEVMPRPQRSRLAWPVETLRNVLAARPVLVGVPLELAWTCRSYHLHVQTPDDLYLAHQRLVKPDHYLAACSADTGPYYRFRSRRGQAHGHFYGRSLPRPPLQATESPAVEFTFYESPPGSDFNALVAAATSLLLVWIVGYAVSQQTSDDFNSDAPAFLLAFPGVAASWIGVSSTPGLLGRSLSARASLLLTTIISILASATFILTEPKVSWARASLRAGISILGVSRTVWCVLVLLALGNAALIGLRFMTRTWRFFNLPAISRMSSESSVGHR